MNMEHTYDWIEYTLATIQMAVMIGILGFMVSQVYKEYKKIV
jgi:hypothetical protein